MSVAESGGLAHRREKERLGTAVVSAKGQGCPPFKDQKWRLLRRQQGPWPQWSPVFCPAEVLVQGDPDSEPTLLHDTGYEGTFRMACAE